MLFFIHKVARYDIVALAEWEELLSCVKIRQRPYGHPIIEINLKQSCHNIFAVEFDSFEKVE